MAVVATGGERRFAVAAFSGCGPRGRGGRSVATGLERDQCSSNCGLNVLIVCEGQLERSGVLMLPRQMDSHTNTYPRLRGLPGRTVSPASRRSNPPVTGPWGGSCLPQLTGPYDVRAV
jgi:hypothetical protein